jgi:hypothetical protein
MKLSLPISHSALPIAVRQLTREQRPLSRIPHSALRTPHSKRGVALVITLVLLSIITFMAVTFLVVSRSQHGSVTTETDLAIARLAADSATERAIADLLAPIQAGTNEFNYGLRVSVNYINPAGFTNNVNNPLNVNYDHRVDGSPFSALDWEQNIANLLYDPRPPVFIVTNALAVKSNEFRFYHDLNHNGRYDPNGLQPVIGTDGLPMKQNGGIIIISNYFVGDPEWIGGLRHPEFSHSADNPFVYRYAYIALPVGQTLDLNRIHNQALRPSKAKLDVAGGDFRRDQGVGTYEMNLAAFLYDLNTNLYAWGGLYRYDPSGGFPAAGNAFADAGALLAYRYAMNPVNASFTLASVRNLFTNGPSVFMGDGIDGYSTASMLNYSGFPQDPDNNPINCTTYPWAGADNPNHFYTTEDLFDKTKTALGLAPRTYSFTDRLIAAGTNNSSYDRTTFYRLLSQLGTDSAPEPGGKMNVNYCNVDASGYAVPNMATNFRPWQPAQFFTNAAIRLLADAGYTVGASGSTSNLLIFTNVSGTSIPTTNLNIPIYPTNLYTPSVHRILQLAANMYDATTIRSFGVATATNGFPTVFRPVFGQGTAVGGRPVGSGQVSIVGYQEVTAADTTGLVSNPTPPIDTSSDPQPWKITANTMFFGIPLVVGAKKGFPNFNKLAMTTLVQVTRKLQFHRPSTSTTASVNEIDEMFVVGISNVLGVEAWNSYSNAYPRNIQLVVWPDVSVLVTNLETRKWLNPPPVLSRWRLWPSPVLTNIPAPMWSGYNQTFPQYSFQVPVLTNLVFLSNMVYRAALDQFVPLTGQFERNPGTTNFSLPHWKLTLKPRLRYALVDTSVNRIVDYVNLADSTDLDITTALFTGGACGIPYTPDGSPGGMWCTNRLNGSTAVYPTFGIQNQIEASMGHTKPDWNSSTHEFPAGMSVSDAVTFFKGQFIPGYLQSSNTFSTPYQPFRNLYLVTSWQANDPLVHYTVSDLTDLVHTNLMVDQLNPPPTPVGQVNARYEPWGGSPAGRSSSAVLCDMTVKDPLMLRSDNWDFPTNKLPNVGWLGRVHRGTPWQTVYFKSFGVNNYPNWFKNWQAWSGNGQIVTNAGQLAPNLVAFNALANDAYFSQPTNDWHLLDLFTTALNDNATRGQLSVNQTNLAAWSAALSGVLVITNTPEGLLSTNVQPAGVYSTSDPVWPPIVRIVNALNIARYNSNPRHVFGRLSDVLATPELTMASPFLNTNNTATRLNNGLNDAAYERLPQQISGLLKADSVPRFVIYAFGQTLKPESTRAIVKSGPFAGLCTNYQIVAESATRTVVRFEGVQPSWRGNPPVMTNLHPVFESSNVLPPN